MKNLILTEMALQMLSQSKGTHYKCAPVGVLDVGGTGTDGGRIYAGSNNTSNREHLGLLPPPGKMLDISAPCSDTLIFTTSGDELSFRRNQYKDFNGTSGATPHVAGVAALLMSYLNHSYKHKQNLFPEDIERILEITATDVSPAGYDTFTGYGRLNAGAAFKIVDKTYSNNKGVFHYFSKDTVISGYRNISLYSSGDTITLPEKYYRRADRKWFNAGKYLVQTYEISWKNWQHAPTDVSVKASWPLPSASDVFPLFDANKKLYPREQLYIDSINIYYGYLHGFVYKVKNLAGDSLGWWPYNPYLKFPEMAYSVLFDTIHLTSIRPIEKQKNSLSLYPDPATNIQTLKISTEKSSKLEISLFDISGRKVLSVYNGIQQLGEQKYNADLSSLSPGLYVYMIKMGENEIHIKTLKLKP